MGARTNFELKDAKGSVWLYSHWGGDSKLHDLANALAKATPRWADPTYAMRIVVSQLIGDEWDSETGYGLSSYEAGEENYEPVTVDFEMCEVTVGNTFFPRTPLLFSDFVELYSSYHRSH